MRLCYIGVMYPNTMDYYKLNNKGAFLQVSTSKFCMNQIEGLEACYKNKIKVFNIPWVPYYPLFPLKEIKTSKWSHNNMCEDIEIGYRNKKIYKTIDQIRNLKHELVCWLTEKPEEEHIIFSCTITISLLWVLCWVKKKFPKVKICHTIVDLPGKDSCEYVKGKSIKNLFRELVSIIDKRLVCNLDAFVFLTKYMPSKMLLKDKPYTVIEGFCSKEQMPEIMSSPNSKVILMAGWLSYAFDIISLLDTFSEKKMQNYTLWLAGSGDAVDAVIAYSEKYSNIKYWGYLSPSEVYELQNKADILINPRRNNHHYIKYSFPGKTFECLKSGKPYLAYKLDCIPEEYDKYIIYIDAKDKDGIANKIIEVCSWEDDRRKKHGKTTWEWVMENKNPEKQCQKMKEMLDRL